MHHDGCSDFLLHLSEEESEIIFLSLAYSSCFYSGQWENRRHIRESGVSIDGPHRLFGDQRE